MKKTVYFAAAALAYLTSCSLIDDAQYIGIDELGLKQKTITVSEDEGTASIKLYCNKHCDISLLDKCSWMKLLDDSAGSDKDVRFAYMYNDGYPRMARVLFDTGSRRDTLTVLQKGLLEESFQLLTTSAVVTKDGGECLVPAIIESGNVELDFYIIYSGGRDWVESCSFRDGTLTIRTSENTTGAIRRAKVFVRWTNGWGEVQTKILQITQTAVSGEISTEKTFEEIRALASGTSSVITGLYSITGYVVGSHNGNAGECYMEEMGYIDYDSNETTVYLESLDGKYGFRLITDSPEENLFEENTKVTVLLEGATLKRGTNPERYDILDVNSAMMLTSEKVDANEIPVKEMYMDQITDSDLYTRVSLLDCEIPVRKGPLTPVNEGYTTLFGADKFAKYPLLTRDIHGSSMYMFTNMTCSYRRTGEILPYGSGKIHGILVHEKYRPFNDNDAPLEEDCGNIGKYQIRHLHKEDIALDKSFDNGFSALLTEYRYMKHPGEVNPEGRWYPTFGDNGWFTHTKASYWYTKNGFHTKGWPYSDHSYLGPCGKDNTGNLNGMGIILEDGSNYGILDSGTNTDGKGCTSDVAAAISWTSTQWYKRENGQYEAWLVNFSTKGITSDCISMQISMMNIQQTNGKALSPRYWKAQWSLTGDMDKADDWTDIGEVFTVPDVVYYANTLLSQCTGHKQMDFPLPRTILGKDNVYVRIFPANDKGSDGYGYDNTKFVAGTSQNNINYFAIRYNK